MKEKSFKETKKYLEEAEKELEEAMQRFNYARDIKDIDEAIENMNFIEGKIKKAKEITNRIGGE